MKELYAYIFLGEFAVFTLLFIFSFTKFSEVFLTKSSFFRIALAGIVILQLISIAILQQEVTDVLLSGSAGWHLRHRIDFYFIDSGNTQYPYFPFLIFIHALANFFSELLPAFTFSFYLKSMLLLPCLYGLAAIMYTQMSRYSKTQARIKVVQFLLNPITYSAVLFHGQSDVVVLFFMIASFAIIIHQKLSIVKLVAGALLFAVSIAVKTWSFTFLPLLAQQVGIKKTAMYLGIITLFLMTDVFVYTRAVEGARVLNVLPAPLSAGGPIGVWGITYIISFVPSLFVFITHYHLVIFGLLFSLLLASIWHIMKRSLWHASLLVVLGLYIILLNWGVQYVFWILPFVFLCSNQHTKKLVTLFWILSTIYVGLNYTNIAFNQTLVNLTLVHGSGLILWGFFVYWFLILLKETDANSYIP